MPTMPAFCDTCGTIFGSGIQIENSANISFSGCTAGPCPKCGGNGNVPDGIYSFFDQTIHILSAKERTREEFAKLAALLKAAKQRNTSANELAAEIEQKVPSLSMLGVLLPKDRNETLQYISLLLAIISIVIALKPSAPSITVNQVIEQVVVASAAEARPVTHHSAGRLRVAAAPKAPPRNAPCPCGSDLKYKRCCGSPQAGK